MRVNVNLSRPAARLRIGAALLAAAAAVAGCGGGEQEQTFEAGRVIAFGDETSLIVDLRGDANGNKYTVNGTVSDTDPALDCKTNPIWIQEVAELYNLVFPQCNPAPNAAVNPQSRIRAAFGARAADLATQIDAQLAESSFRDGDLATVLVGVNDVLAQYAQFPGVPESTLIANVEAAGAEVARQVNRLAAADVRVLIATIPDVSYSPFAIAERTANPGVDRQELIRSLVSRFNASLRATIINDGRRIGLVLADELVQTSARFPGFNGIGNVTTGVCDLSRSQLVPPSILDCTRLTLITGGSVGNYLWADDRRLGAPIQTLLGKLAAQRAQINPF